MDDLKNLKPGMLTYDLAGMPVFDTTKVYLIKPSIDHPIVPGQPVPKLNVVELHNVKVTPSVFIEPETIVPEIEVPKIEVPKIEDWHVPGSVSINVKHYFSKADKKLLRRRYFKKVRLPRKLKKAYRKMTIREMKPKVELGGGKNANDVKITMSSYLGMKHGYKRTKWVNKAFCHFKKLHKAWEERTTKQMQEYMKQQAAEMVVTKEQQARLAEMLRKKSIETK